MLHANQKNTYFEGVLYAIVDIETTGSYAHLNSITEIAVIITDGVTVTDRYETLIKPSHPIPQFITALTNITNEMVSNAPQFAEIAPDLFELLKDKIFVAHHVSFDYGFIKKALEAEGYSFNVKRLCTVRLSRKIFPGLPSYSLGKLTKQLSIPHHNPHRAMGDTEATVKLFHRLYTADDSGVIKKALKGNSHEMVLPAHLSREVFTNLPEAPGVYYFYNEKGKIIYIGKAINIKKRIYSHFSSSEGSRKKQHFKREIYNISFELTGTELIAYLLEDKEIKKYWPKYNSAQKDNRQKYAVYIYTDQNGDDRLVVDKARKHLPALMQFTSLLEARSWLIKQMRNYKLNPLLCGLPDFVMLEEVINHKKGVKELKEDITNNRSSFAIIDNGRNVDEQSLVLVKSGEYKGFGYIPADCIVTTDTEFEDYINLQHESATVKTLIAQVYRNEPHKVINLL